MIFRVMNPVLHLVHTAVILGSLLLWLFESLLVVHLWLQAAILCSWLVIGPLFKSPGMCIVTELQRALNRMHNIDFPASYMTYLYSAMGITITDEERVNTITFFVFAMCTVISVLRLWQGI